MVRRLLLPMILLGAVALWASRATAPPSLRGTLRENEPRLSVSGVRLGDSTTRVHEVWREHLKLDPARLALPATLRWVDDYREPTVGLSQSGTVVYVSGLSLELDGTPLVTTGEDTHLDLGPPDEVREFEGSADEWTYGLGEVDLELSVSDPGSAGRRTVFLVGLRDRRANIQKGFYVPAMMPTSGAGSSPGPWPAPSRR